MGDHRVGVREAGTDVVGLEIGIVREDILRCFTLGEEAQNQLHGASHAANDGSSAEDLRVCRDSLQEVGGCHGHRALSLPGSNSLSSPVSRQLRVRSAHRAGLDTDDGSDCHLT